MQPANQAPGCRIKKRKYLMLSTASPPHTPALGDFLGFWGHWADTHRGTPAEPPAVYMIAGA